MNESRDRHEDEAEQPEPVHVVDEGAQKSYREILREELKVGSIELVRKPGGLLLSSLAAGIDISFGVFLMAILLTLGGERLGELPQRLALANMYAVGFIFVSIGRSELFTEHTTLAVLPVLNGNQPPSALVRLWVIVWCGNIVGGALMAGLLVTFGPWFEAATPEAFVHIGREMAHHSWSAIFVSGILAAWLMGLLSWLTAATRDTIGQIVCVWLITVVIGFVGLHHCVAANVEVLVGLFSSSSEITPLDYLKVQSAATLGNILGGGLFAAIRYAHSVRGQEGEANDTPVDESPEKG